MSISLTLRRKVLRLRVEFRIGQIDLKLDKAMSELEIWNSSHWIRSTLVPWPESEGGKEYGKSAVLTKLLSRNSVRNTIDPVVPISLQQALLGSIDGKRRARATRHQRSPGP